MIKKNKGGVPGDLPASLVSEFAPELAKPLSIIFNKIIETGKWPTQWKTEHGIPLQKINNPKNEDDVRVISLTPFFSKVMEKFIIEWLLDCIGDKIDWHQYGGQKGNSVTHYLIEFINFIQYNQDLSDIHATLAVFVDFSKAFNRQDHNILVTLLSDLGVPGWLLLIIIGFLEDRNLILSFKDEKSDLLPLPGGGPQSTILGLFLFLVLINAAGLKNLTRNTGTLATAALRRRRPLEELHLKYVDDMTFTEAVKLKDKLKVDPMPTRPTQYRERTGHVLNNELVKMNENLMALEKYTFEKSMKINTKKTNVMVFNSSRTLDFLPKLQISENQDLEVVEEQRLLGVIISSNLNWQSHINHMSEKAFKRMWILRRLKLLGASCVDLLKVYTTQIRCIVEFAVAAWNGSITKAQISQLERIQKCALGIILGKEYVDYEAALNLVDLESLAVRRKSLCLKFAKKAANHPKFKHWFCKSQEKVVNTRSVQLKYVPVTSRTQRYEKSPLSYLTTLLNEN